MLLGELYWIPEKLCCPGEGWCLPACLPACKEQAIKLVDCEVSQVIFPSFLHTKLLNLFTYLFLSLLNLNSPTFSTKTWHFLKLVVDKIDANFDLHSSLCLVLFSKILLMDLIFLPVEVVFCCSNYFLAFSVNKHRTKSSKYCPSPPRFWCRFVDDTFVIHKEVNKQDFLQHINSVDPAIRFTVEDSKEDGSIPFLDTIVKPEADGSLSITVYRKPKHRDQYLQWDSHHHLSTKFSVIHTFSHRAKTVCSKPELLQEEKEHLRKALTKCKYPKWTLDNVEKRLNKSTSEGIDGANNQGTTVAQAVTSKVKTKSHIVIPYTQGLCESMKRICGRYDIQTHFKGGNTIKNLLVSPKDKDSMVNQSGAIYWHQCCDLGYDDEYIGETSKTFGERYKEHLKAPSPIHHHSNQTGHPTSHNNFQIIGREGHNLARNIKESIFIRVNNPSLNNNIGKFNLPYIWDRVLLNTQGLNLKSQTNNNSTQSN